MVRVREHVQGGKPDGGLRGCRQTQMGARAAPRRPYWYILSLEHNLTGETKAGGSLPVAGLRVRCRPQSPGGGVRMACGRL